MGGGWWKYARAQSKNAFSRENAKYGTRRKRINDINKRKWGTARNGDLLEEVFEGGCDGVHCNTGVLLTLSYMFSKGEGSTKENDCAST